MRCFVDPVERIPAHRTVVGDVDRAATVAATASGARPGRDFRHAFWREKQRLLLITHGIYWRTPAERRTSRLRSVRRAVVEAGMLLLVGGVLAGALAWLVNSGRVEADTVGVILLAVGVPLLAAVVWIGIRAAREPWDEWDDDGTNDLT